MFDEYIKVGNFHNEIKEKLRKMNISSMSTNQINNFILNEIKNSNFKDNINNGIAFPVNISIDNCVCHNCIYDDNIIGEDHLVKIDFGIHNKGYIVDSALSINTGNNDMINEMINTVKEAISVGLKNSGPDVILGELGESIQEVIESFSYNNFEGKSISDFCGHKIDKYVLHAKKALPNIKVDYYKSRMVVGEVYAIEPFLSNYSNKVYYDYDNSSLHSINFFETMIERNDKLKLIKNIEVVNYYKDLQKKYFTLPFNETRNLNLEYLIDRKLVLEFPVAYVKDSFVAHEEENFGITEFGIKRIT